MKSLPPWLMAACLVVSGTRMTSLFIAMDGRGLEGTPLVVAILGALATAVALTGGQLQIAWRIALYEGHRIKLCVIWLAIMAGATVLGTVAVLRLFEKDGSVVAAMDPTWLASNIPAVLLALAVAGLPEITATGLAIGHGDGVVVDGVVVRLREELVDRELKLGKEIAELRLRVQAAEKGASRVADQAKGLRKKLAERSSPASGGQLRPVESNGQLECAYEGCGWKTPLGLPTASAPRSLSSHRGKCEKRKAEAG